MSCERCEELRERAENAESRIASVSGVTRERLAAREYERGLAEGKAVRDELLAFAELYLASDDPCVRGDGTCTPDDQCIACDLRADARAVLAKAGGAR